MFKVWQALEEKLEPATHFGVGVGGVGGGGAVNKLEPRTALP